MIRMFSFAARKRLLNHFVRLALWYNVRKGLYRPEPQGSCNWYANLLLNVVKFLKSHNILQHYSHGTNLNQHKNKAMLYNYIKPANSTTLLITPLD